MMESTLYSGFKQVLGERGDTRDCRCWNVVKTKVAEELSLSGGICRVNRQTTFSVGTLLKAKRKAEKDWRKRQEW